jgi:hypothetical protein
MSVPYNVSVTGVGTSSPLPLNRHGLNGWTAQAIVTGTATFSIEGTMTNVLANGSGSATWTALPNWSALSATTLSSGTAIPEAIRLNVTAGTGTVQLIFTQHLISVS